MDNLTLQVDEIEALSSIYENELQVIDEYSRVYMFTICGTLQHSFEFQVTLPQTYPSDSAPKYEIRAPWLKSEERIFLHQRLDQISIENKGESVLYLWVESLREFVQEKIDALMQHLTTQTVSLSAHNVKTEKYCEIPTPVIYHGETLTDRKSTFQGHAASVTTLEQVKAVKKSLLDNRKIANATHNIVAYRISNNSNSSLLQDCDDDGETAAGGRLLHLLQILDLKDVVVIVSRWYGGIKLGPDRFKHINNAARNILSQEGFIAKESKKPVKSK